MRPQHKLLNYNCQVVNSKFLLSFYTCLNNKLFSHELKILNYDGLWENKNFPDENQRFDVIKSIHGY